jgi:hypothetical protein
MEGRAVGISRKVVRCVEAVMGGGGEGGKDGRSVGRERRNGRNGKLERRRDRLGGLEGRGRVHGSRRTPMSTGWNRG